MKSIFILIAVLLFSTLAFSQSAAPTMSVGYNRFKIATPSDVATLTDASAKAVTTRAIMIGGTGTLAIADASGTSVTLTGLSVGTIHLLRTNKIFSTGTTATNIAIFW